MAEAAEKQSEFVLVFSTTGSLREAERIGRLLVENHLIACANVIPSVRSFYRWQGEVCQDSESLLLMKTTVDRLEALETELRRLHSYEVPELIVTPIIRGFESYLNWVRDMTHPEA
ncbi:MAG: divalent-cation tolerance protein CutA [Calditrichaeota bacterium]|nr:MAG: divalent-cation tolerance protein CutA [Calditrichota bacterium]